MINGGVINGFTLNGSGDEYDDYDVVAFIEQQITLGDEYNTVAIIEQRILGYEYDVVANIASVIYGEYDTVAVIEQDIVGYTDYDSVAPIQQVVYGDYDSVAQIQQVIFNLAAFDSDIWTIRVDLGGVDISTRITGAMEIDLEESSSGIAELLVEPVAGIINPKDWTNKAIVVFYNAMDDAGNITSTMPIYNGVVDIPEYDISQNLVRLSCTDNLQRVFESKTRSQIASVTLGRWSKFVFDEKADSWTYAENRMSTRQASLDLDINRQPVVTDWAAKSVADFTFNLVDDIDDGSLVVSVAGARDLVNKINLNVEYRYERLMQRDIPYTFYLPIEDLLSDPLGVLLVPEPYQIEQAINGTGWAVIHDPYMLGLPGYGDYPNPLSPGSSIAWTSDCPRYTYASTAEFILSKRWTQTVTETWGITIEATASINELGELISEDSMSMSLSDDTLKRADVWTEEVDKPFSVVLYTGAIPANPYCNTWVERHDLLLKSYAADEYPVMQSFAETGDRYFDLDDGDEDGRTAFQNAYRTSIDKAMAQVASSHRQGNVVFTTDIRPLINRTHTVAIDSARVKTKGKVRRVRHIIDIQSGEASTEITTAISQTFGAGLVTPTVIDTEAKQEIPLVPEAALTSNVGVIPVFKTTMPEDTQGWDAINGIFAIKTPGVEQANVDHAEVTYSRRYKMTVPNDLFTVEAP